MTSGGTPVLCRPVESLEVTCQLQWLVWRFPLPSVELFFIYCSIMSARPLAMFVARHCSFV